MRLTLNGVYLPNGIILHESHPPRGMMISLTRRLSTLARQFSTATSRMSYPSSVQAITISKTGGPEVIEKREIPFPKVAPNHLVVKVESLSDFHATVNV